MADRLLPELQQLLDIVFTESRELEQLPRCIMAAIKAPQNPDFLINVIGKLEIVIFALFDLLQVLVQRLLVNAHFFGGGFEV